MVTWSEQWKGLPTFLLLKKDNKHKFLPKQISNLVPPLK